MLRRLSGALLTLIAALALAQGAVAKPHTITFDGGRSMEFNLRGSNGYKLGVTSLDSTVSVTAIGKSREGMVSYLVRRKPHGKRGFEAKLPGIGRIAVQFRPIGKPRKQTPFPECSGRPGLRQAGVFVGTINFHGERGYTEITTTRARGVVIRTFPQTCKFDESEGGGKRPEDRYKSTDLVAIAQQGSVLFSASRIEFGGKSGPPPFLSYMATQFTRSRGMGVVRFVFGEGPLGSFSAEHTGRSASARAEPSPPFTGSGDFAVATDGTVSWTGDLSVTFPGTGPIRLTGKRFEAQLCVQSKCAGDPLGIGGESVSVFSAGARPLAQRLPLPGFGRGKALLVDVIAEAR